MGNIVKQWYETKKNVDEMHHWENLKLKKWEQNVAHYFPVHAKILDIGCGLGRESFLLTDRGYRLAAIDISKEVISQVRQLSKQKGYNIPFCEYDGHTLPFDACSFDAVIIWSQTFGIMYGSDYKKEFLLECKRVLKKDGLISFSAHDYEFLAENFSNCLKDRKFYPYANAEIYWEAFEPNELMCFAKQAGYEVILCEKGEIYKPEDGTVLHCLCKKSRDALA